MIKDINLINLKIDANMDADDFGQRLVDCARLAVSDANYVNLIKIHLGDNISLTTFIKMVETQIATPLRDMGCTHCIFVPIKDGFIEDITVDKIEVVTNGTNS